MIPEDLEQLTRQELIDVILILAKILKEEDAVIEQNDILFRSEKVQQLKRELSNM